MSKRRAMTTKMVHGLNKTLSLISFLLVIAGFLVSLIDSIALANSLEIPLF